MEMLRDVQPVLVACPDARPPAYQAVVGLSRAGLLGRFVTASYYDRNGRMAAWARRLAPERLRHLERFLLRRHDPDIPAERVSANPAFDLALRLETRFAARRPRFRRAVARWRTEWFDLRLARTRRAQPAGSSPGLQ